MQMMQVLISEMIGHKTHSHHAQSQPYKHETKAQQIFDTPTIALASAHHIQNKQDQVCMLSRMKA